MANVFNQISWNIEKYLQQNVSGELDAWMNDEVYVPKKKSNKPNREEPTMMNQEERREDEEMGKNLQDFSLFLRAFEGDILRLTALGSHSEADFSDNVHRGSLHKYAVITWTENQAMVSVSHPFEVLIELEKIFAINLELDW